MSDKTEESSRKRVTRACDLCRRKKVRCDGATPICTNCKIMDLTCTFKDTTKKRGPPKGYVEAIENRLNKLESFLGDLAKNGNVESKALLSELNSPLETLSGEQILDRPTRRTIKPDLSRSEGKRKRETPDQEDPILTDEGQLSIDEHGQARYLGKSSGFYLLQDSKNYRNGAFDFTRYGHQVRSKASDMPMAFQSPPDDLAHHLIQLYFTHFYRFLPMFFRPSFSSSDSLLLNAIYAVASRISPDPRVRSDPDVPESAGDVFYERAEVLLDTSYDKPSIATVQALLLLSTFQHGAMKYAKAWLYSGMAFRMAQDLGLHRNCDHWNISPEEREGRKRVFWCCYVVDRLISAMYGRASMFEEKDCDIPFPGVDDEPPLIEGFIQLIKISDILGHVLRNMYYVRSQQYTRPNEAVLEHWYQKLQAWQDALPTSLDPTDLAVIQLQMIYHTTIILLHRPFIKSPDLPSATICLGSAQAIVASATSLLDRRQLRYVLNYTVYYLFTSGIVLLREGSEDFKPCMRALEEIAVTWLTASKIHQILTELSGPIDQRPVYSVPSHLRFTNQHLMYPVALDSFMTSVRQEGDWGMPLNLNDWQGLVGPAPVRVKEDGLAHAQDRYQGFVSPMPTESSSQTYSDTQFHW